MKEKRQDWTYSEFRTYLLLYAANADFVIKDEEKEVILEGSNKKELKHIAIEFDKDTEAEKLDTILWFKDKYYPNKEDVDKLIDEVIEIFTADNEVHHFERNFLMFLEKLLR
jgi:hypothetical protein